MTKDSYKALCDRVRGHCVAQEWYGPDGDKPTSRHDVIFGTGRADKDHLGYETTRGRRYAHEYDSERHLHTFLLDNTTDPRRMRFECPPATDKQLQATEDALGYPLPPLLRTLYAEVANGGFGPGYGITGAMGGWTVANDGHYETIDAEDLWPGKTHGYQFVEIADYDQEPERPFTIWLPRGLYPAHLLPFCYLGCGMDECIDLTSGRIYVLGAGGDDDMGQPQLNLARRSLTFEEWLDTWLRQSTNNG